MNSAQLLRFYDYFKKYEFNLKTKQYPTLDIGKSGSEFVDNIKTGISKSKVYEIPDNVKHLIATTKPTQDSSDLNLPFDYVFLDVNFTREELGKIGVRIKAQEIVGIMVTVGNLVETKSYLTHKLYKGIDSEEAKKYPVKSVGKALRITTLAVEEEKDEGQEFIFTTYNKDAIITDDEFSGRYEELIAEGDDAVKKRFVHRFVLSFLNFLYCPDVTWVEHIRSEKNQQRRIREGKLPLQTSLEVKLTGNLRRYLDDRESGKEFTYGFRFDVSGHWRTLSSDRYTHKKGQRIFIGNFVKGTGVYIDKHRVLEGKQC